MSESRSRPVHRTTRRTAGLVGFATMLWTLGCASTGQPPGDLAPVLPVSESRLETAPPAARDALEEGLKWIADDAPATTVGKNTAIHLATGDGL